MSPSQFGTTARQLRSAFTIFERASTKDERQAAFALLSQQAQPCGIIQSLVPLSAFYTFGFDAVGAQNRLVKLLACLLVSGAFMQLPCWAEYNRFARETIRVQPMFPARTGVQVHNGCVRSGSASWRLAGCALSARGSRSWKPSAGQLSKQRCEFGFISLLRSCCEKHAVSSGLLVSSLTRGCLLFAAAFHGKARELLNRALAAADASGEVDCFAAFQLSKLDPSFAAKAATVRSCASSSVSLTLR